MTAKRNGRRRGVQMYKCTHCEKYFQSKRRQQKTSTQLFHEYVWKRQTYTDLGEEHARSAKWVQRTLDEVSVKKVVVASARRVTLVLDATFFSRGFGTLVFREAWTKKNLWWKHIESEKLEHYQHGKKHLEVNGFTIQAVVIDGRRGVKQLFRDIPVQMCHFHQAQIVQRYITKNPKLKASKELKKIVETLTSTNEYTFSKNLIEWHETWKEFLKEKTTHPLTERWSYTHKKVRSAYKSLNTNLPYLFTYQKYPELHIPNTTNQLEGFFTYVKELLNVHRGLIRKRKVKLIDEILKGKPKF